MTTAKITINTAFAWQRPLRPDVGRAFIYVGGVLVVQTRAHTDAEAVREAVKQFRLTRADRKAEASGVRADHWAHVESQECRG